MKVQGTQYTARYWIGSIQCGSHISRDDHDVTGDNKRGYAADGVITWNIMGPALVIGANDACVVAANDDAAIAEPGVYDNEDRKFEGNGLSPADIPAFGFPTQCEGPCEPSIAEGNANAPAGGCVDPQVRVEPQAQLEGVGA